jgi:hypothetical protein
MDEQAFRETVKHLEEVNAVVSKLDGSIRAAAFEVLRPYVTKGSANARHTPEPEKRPTVAAESATLEQLLDNHKDAEPHENANLAAAYWYSQYGTAPFSLEKIKNLGNDAGLIIPDRLDMTFKQAKSEGKALFQVVARGLYKPTVTGEGYLRKTFGVTKGTNNPSQT